ncbi:hypothetical protein PV11_02324 [Exophiala sideris]|uniref:Zn(2)-C6 fungal-type domain-containing protein n=1 Tax=Exophiala sideris TaxID=1016849 RepID=A0A0D1YYW8_9EURO|nr:hypothetical protein PV11_02324 [Exophiala sideris]
MAPAVKQVRRLQTACDRCYRLKERCSRQSITDICGRCARLGLVCATVRPPRPAGRKPRRVQDDPNVETSAGSTSSACSANASLAPHDIGKWITDLSDLGQHEKKKLLFLLDQPENLSTYVVSPRFQDAERRSLAAHLPAALPVLLDAYLARAGALKLKYPDDHDMAEIVDDGHVNLLHASSAMKTLRALPVATPQDAALCLTLGISLALFGYSTLGQGVYEISRHCLSMTRPFIETEMLDPEAERSLTFLVLMEIMECLVQRRRPTIRFPERQPLGLEADVVDRHLGLCVPLLPYYHDLCVVSHSLANTTDASYLALVETQLGRIQAEVEAWQPSQPDQFMEQFQSTEVVQLLTQARVYRLAALLVSHRLRYTFGAQDEQAGIWAREIMIELELARRITRRSAHCVTLPFIAAALEMQDPAARHQALQNVDVYVDQFAPMVQKATKTFLSRVWAERDNKVTASWFDSTCKPCVVLASIDTALFG